MARAVRYTAQSGVSPAPFVLKLPRLLEIAVNVVKSRRYSWLAIIAIATSVCLPQTLVAQQDSSGPEAPSSQLKTVAVLAGARYEKLLSDVSFLGSMIGKPEAGQMADAMVNQFTMGKAATALDKTKPWGVIVQTDGANFHPVACLPVGKPDDALEVVKAYGGEVKDGENGTKELAIPGKPSLYMKAQNDVVFIAQTVGSLEKLPANPLDILGKMVGDYDLSIAISFKNVPDMYRQFAMKAMEAGLQQGMQKLPDETDEQFAERQQAGQAQLGQLTRVINEIDKIQVGWAIDAEQKRTYFDFTYQFLPGSKTAKQVAANADPHTNFAGFFQPDAAATFTFTNKTDPKDIADDLAQLENMMRAQRAQLNHEIEKHVGDVEGREALKAALTDCFDAVEGTIKEGHIDGGATLSLSPSSLTFVAGTHIKEPGKIESALKKLEPVAKKSPEFSGINWNAASHGGVNFHTMSLPTPTDEEAARQLLGDQIEIAIGIGPDAVFVAVGRDNMAAVSKAIDESNANKGKAVPPFELAVSVAQILEVAGGFNDNPREKQLIQTVVDTVKDQAQGRDHVRVVGKAITNGLRYRIEAEEGVLRAIGAAAAARQAQ